MHYEGRPIEELRDELPDSLWTHNRLFEEVGAAIEMKLTPTSFWLLDETDKALIMAHRRATSTIRAYEEHLASKRSKSGKKRATASRS